MAPTKLSKEKMQSENQISIHKEKRVRLAEAEVARNVELTLNVSAKNFPLLNKCRDFSIHAHKMSHQDIAQAIYSLQNSPQAQDSGEATTASSRPVRRGIAAEPTVGPSRGIERITEPVVLLDDIRLAFPFVRYIS